MLTEDTNKLQEITRHRASTSMYSLTFCVRFLLPERQQWKPAFQTAAVMLRTTPVGGRSPAAGRARFPCAARGFGGAARRPPVAGRRRRAQTPPSRPFERTMSSYRGMDASLWRSSYYDSVVAHYILIWLLAWSLWGAIAF